MQIIFGEYLQWSCRSRTGFLFKFVHVKLKLHLEMHYFPEERLAY